MDNLNNLEKNNAEDLRQDIFDDAASVLEVELEEEGGESDGYALTSGRALNEKELYQLSSRKHTKIIYVLGPVKSGKTTFEAMLYAFFLKNINSEIMFAGSETLFGFEERLNYLRTNSGNSEPQMARTSKDERRCFLHLNLLNTVTNHYRNLVFVDVSGEMFEGCKTNRLVLEQDLQFLDIASNIVLFIDGESLLNDSLRNGCVLKVKTFLKTLSSSACFNDKCCIDIIISKNDLVYANADDLLNNYIDNLDNEFSAFKDIFTIKLFRIEALNPSIKDEKHSTNLVELLKYWMKEDVQNAHMENKRIGKKQLIYNDFNRFGERYYNG